MSAGEESVNLVEEQGDGLSPFRSNHFSFLPKNTVHACTVSDNHLVSTHFSVRT